MAFTKGSLIAVALSSFAIGVGVGYLVTHKVAKEKESARANEMIEGMRDYYKFKYEGLKAEHEAKQSKDAEPTVVVKQPESQAENTQGLSDIISDDDATIPRTSYGTYFDEPETVEEVVEVAAPLHTTDSELVAMVDSEGLSLTSEYRDQDSFELNQECKHAGLPYVIPYQEFLVNEVEHEQTTLNFYIEDSTLVDENDQYVEDLIKVLGPEALGLFGYMSQNEDTVYVRNNKMEMDFEVCKVEGSWLGDEEWEVPQYTEEQLQEVRERQYGDRG